MTETELIDRLVAAQRAGTNTVDPQDYAQLDREAAYRIQTGVLSALGATVGMLKTGIQTDGVGIVAPIYASKVGTAPFRLSAVNVIGLEVEVGVVLRHDLPSDASTDAAKVAAAVHHYFLGVEICGSRYPDRKAAGANGGLADNMAGLGYVIGPTRFGGEIGGLEVVLEFAGKTIHAAPAKHAFGDTLASLIAYAKNQHPAYPLKAGTIITTGSMCGLVPTSGPGHVVARLAHEKMEFDLV
jgi:2-keto-4-pentenoate hydratase